MPRYVRSQTSSSIKSSQPSYYAAPPSAGFLLQCLPEIPPNGGLLIRPNERRMVHGDQLAGGPCSACGQDAQYVGGSARFGSWNKTELPLRFSTIFCTKLIFWICLKPLLNWLLNDYCSCMACRGSAVRVSLAPFTFSR